MDEPPTPCDHVRFLKSLISYDRREIDTKDIVDDTQEFSCAGVDGLAVLFLLRRKMRVQEKHAASNDSIEWCPNLMAHIRQN
jgi:hypothetical protein